MTTTGTRLGRYEIRSKLGASGMGEVYLAEDTGLNRKVAIKFLRDDSVSDPQAKKRIVREAQAAAAFDHPNICAIHEVGEEEGRTFIVMQYVEDETLAGRLKRQPLELREVLSVTAQVADGLAEAHSRGIIHRDIKPANIMLTARGQVKVMDFGLAKVVRDKSLAESEAMTESLLTEPGAIVGTVPYMSPEQARGLKVDHRTDIFSLGVILYEMLAGRRPYEGETASDVLAAILQNDPLRLTAVDPKTPRELERIVSKLLRKERDERYQTVKDLLVDFKIFQQESSSAAAAVALARGTRRLPSRRLLVLISILALLAAAGGLFWWQSRPAAPPSIGSTPVDQLSRLRDQPGALVRWQTGSLCVEW